MLLHVSFGNSPRSVMETLCFFRFWLAFGIGGDYPLSATIMSEYANKKTRSAFLVAAFGMRGFGILTDGIFAIIISAAFKARFDAPSYEVDPVGSTVPQADYIWRIIRMVEALTAVLTCHWRMKMPETARYTALVAKNVKQAASDMSRVLEIEMAVEQKHKVGHLGTEFCSFSKEFMHQHGLHLLGTTSTWLLLDIPFFG